MSDPEAAPFPFKDRQIGGAGKFAIADIGYEDTISMLSGGITTFHESLSTA